MDTHKSPDLETIHNHNRRRRRRRRPTTSFSQDFKTTHEIKNLQGSSADGDDHETITKTSSSLATGDKAEGSSTPPPSPAAIMVVESGRERLKRHRVEMSGRVWIPDIWGQEDLLKKWIDCTVFDSSLEKSSIMSAREALIQEGRSSLLRIENSC